MQLCVYKYEYIFACKHNNHIDERRQDALEAKFMNIYEK